LIMLTRYAGCGKRACTLVSSLCVKERVKTNPLDNSRNISTLYTRDEHSGKEKQTTSYWTGLLAASVIAASADTESENACPPESVAAENILSPSASSGTNSEENVVAESEDPLREILKNADKLFYQQRYVELDALLQGCAHVNSAEVLWRRARAQFEIIKREGQDPSILARSRRVRQMQEVVDLVDQALELDETNSSAHCWKAILSNACSGLAGFKAQFQNLETMKYHLQRAIELNPNNNHALTLLGTWHMNLLDLNVFIRGFVRTVMKIPVNCSYMEALDLFLKAEEIAPKASIVNLYMTGKAYFRLNHKTKAKQYVELALAQRAVDDEDLMYLEEAKQFYRDNLAS